jgi:hypothetical protein
VGLEVVRFFEDVKQGSWRNRVHSTSHCPDVANCHAQIHMARELGMNPAKLGKIDNHKQQPWKLPLPQFIEELYFKRFGKTCPEAVLSIESDAASKQRRRRKGAPRGCVPWTARPGS